MQVTYARNESRLFWSLEKPDYPQLKLHAGKKWRWCLVSPIYIFDFTSPVLSPTRWTVLMKHSTVCNLQFSYPNGLRVITILHFNTPFTSFPSPLDSGCQTWFCFVYLLSSSFIVCSITLFHSWSICLRLNSSFNMPRWLIFRVYVWAIVEHTHMWLAPAWPWGNGACQKSIENEWVFKRNIDFLCTKD